MADILYITTILQVTLCLLIIFIALAYSLLILLIRRFRHPNNIFILNICLAIIGACVYFIIYSTMGYFDPGRLYATNMCLFLFYAYNIVCIEIPFSFVTFSVHRFCSIIYHTKPFSKKKRWVAICIGSQWMGEFVISLPFIFRKESVCNYETWMRIYSFLWSLFVPILINVVLNIRIFVYVRNSTRRVQPQVITTITNGNNNQQQPKLSRRDISLLRQMIFMFAMFIGGWTPVFSILISSQYIYIDQSIFQSFVIVSELSILAIIINLLMCNHELKELLINKVRQCIQWL